MSTIVNQVEQVLPLKTSHDLFLKEVTTLKKGFFGAKKVTRLHLATKNQAGEIVLLDQKGIKATKGFFGTSIRVQAQSGRFKEYKVNTSSLKHLYERLEGKKVFWLKEKSSSDLGARILKATTTLLQQATQKKVKELVSQYNQEHGQIQSEIHKAQIDMHHQLDQLHDEITALEAKIAKVEAYIKTYPGSSSHEKTVTLPKLKAEHKEKVEEHSELSRTSPASTTSFSSLDPFFEQLEAVNMTVLASDEEIAQKAKTIQVRWEVQQPNAFERARLSGEARIVETRIDERLRLQQQAIDEQDWWVKTIENKLEELEKDPLANQEQIAHYRAVLAKRVN